MTNLSRRAALIGSVAALEVATLVSQRAYAALPRDRLTEIGSPGFFKFKVGNFTVITVNDGYAGRALEGMVLNAPIAEVQRVMADAFLPTDKYNGPYTATFVDTGKMLIALGWKMGASDGGFGRYECIENRNQGSDRVYAAASEMRADGCALAY